MELAPFVPHLVHDVTSHRLLSFLPLAGPQVHLFISPSLSTSVPLCPSLPQYPLILNEFLNALVVFIRTCYLDFCCIFCPAEMEKRRNCESYHL